MRQSLSRPKELRCSAKFIGTTGKRSALSLGSTPLKPHWVNEGHAQFVIGGYAIGTSGLDGSIAIGKYAHKRKKLGDDVWSMLRRNHLSH
jgi:hypothetical protein